MNFLHINDKNPPWYITGLAFECLECGRCCAGPEEGYVWATEEEISKAAEFMKLSDREFRTKYVRRVGLRKSFKEDKKSHDCIFLKDGSCSIYPVRPTQCRTWPFWKSNIATPDDWAEAGQRCVGVNRGQLHPIDEIERKAGITEE